MSIATYENREQLLERMVAEHPEKIMEIFQKLHGVRLNTNDIAINASIKTGEETIREIKSDSFLNGLGLLKWVSNPSFSLAISLLITIYKSFLETMDINRYSKPLQYIIRLNAILFALGLMQSVMLRLFVYGFYGLDFSAMFVKSLSDTMDVCTTNVLQDFKKIAQDKLGFSATSDFLQGIIPVGGYMVKAHELYKKIYTVYLYVSEGEEKSQIDTSKTKIKGDKEFFNQLVEQTSSGDVSTFAVTTLKEPEKIASTFISFVKQLTTDIVGSRFVGDIKFNDVLRSLQPSEIKRTFSNMDIAPQKEFIQESARHFLYKNNIEDEYVENISGKIGRCLDDLQGNIVLDVTRTNKRLQKIEDDFIYTFGKHQIGFRESVYMVSTTDVFVVFTLLFWIVIMLLKLVYKVKKSIGKSTTYKPETTKKREKEKEEDKRFIQPYYNVSSSYRYNREDDMRHLSRRIPKNFSEIDVGKWYRENTKY